MGAQTRWGKAGEQEIPLPSQAQQQDAWETSPGKREERARERLSAMGGLAMAVTSRVVSVKHVLVQPYVRRKMG